MISDIDEYIIIPSRKHLRTVLIKQMLACKHFQGRHTADNIVAQYEETVNELKYPRK